MSIGECAGEYAGLSWSSHVLSDETLRDSRRAALSRTYTEAPSCASSTRWVAKPRTIGSPFWMLVATDGAARVLAGVAEDLLPGGSSAPLRQRVGQEFSAVVRAHREDDELLAVDLIGHRRSRLSRRHVHRARVGSGVLVVGP